MNKKIPGDTLFLIVILWATALQAQPAEVQKGFKPLTAALHVHSQFSDGEYSISNLGSLALERKLDAIGFSDSFLTRVRYGVGPLKKLFSKSVDRHSVMDAGIDSYFDSIAAAQRENSNVVMLPGFEIAPYYYWRGSWPGDLELHDFDRHVLVFGMQDRAALRNLPVIENATWSNSGHSLMLLAGPAIVLLSGVLFAVISIVARGGKGYKVIAGLLLIAGALWAYDAFPFGQLSNPYSEKEDYAAFQRVIDYIDAHDGLAYWSYPEAHYPDVRIPGARMISRGQPEMLGVTDRYRGFEGLYGDTITITNPGNLWDHILIEYLHGDRRTWPSVITGIDFHSFNKSNNWFQLDHGLTVLFATEKTAAALLDALKTGRGYATFQKDSAHRVGLSDFALRANGETAISGQSLKTPGDVDFSATLDWMVGDNEAGNDTEATIKLIRDGELLDEYRSKLPAVIQRHDMLDAGPHYYRLMAQFDGTQILSNPIFCEVAAH